jgi:hypothetical protein
MERDHFAEFITYLTTAIIMITKVRQQQTYSYQHFTKHFYIGLF